MCTSFTRVVIWQLRRQRWHIEDEEFLVLEHTGCDWEEFLDKS